MDGSARVTVAELGLDVDVYTDTEFSDEDSMDSPDDENCDYGHNQSLPDCRYLIMKPVDRRCSYCGAYKGSAGKKIMECTRDGRKLCVRCYPNNHLRHRRYMIECDNNYVNDGDSNCLVKMQ